MTSLLEVQDLRVHFPARRRGWRPPAVVRAVDGVSLRVEAGETVGVVGESGCGKTTLARAVLRLIPPTSGRVLLDGEDLGTRSGKELRRCRRRLQMIFQHPLAALDPRMTVAQILGEALDLHRLALGRPDRQQRLAELLEVVGLDVAHAARYPHELSGGQRQRIGIARALAVEPALVVCDEPVSALDVSVQAQIVNLLADLQERRRLSYLFIAHDLAVVEHLSRRILVMYLGRVVEAGPAHALVSTPRHPYTQALVAAVPVFRAQARSPSPLHGEPPSPLHPPSGCPFHPRCPLAKRRCRTEAPALRGIGTEREVACHVVAG